MTDEENTHDKDFHAYIMSELKKAEEDGYQRGKEEAEKRIWEAVKKSQTIAEFFELRKLAGGVRMSELQQIIFGGGDVD